MNYFDHVSKTLVTVATREPRREFDANNMLRADIEARRKEGARILARSARNEMPFNLYPSKGVHAFDYRTGYRGVSRK